MQRWCTKLRALSLLHSPHKPTQLSLSSSSIHRLLHYSPQLLYRPLAFTAISPNFKPLFNASSASHPSLFNQTVVSSYPPLLYLSLIQVRHRTKKEKREKTKKFKPWTPVTSKMKKTKMKCYSSYKGRFRVLNDGTIRRWKEGKRHNAHLKSKAAKRRLRQPGIVPLAYAKVMKKLNFCG